MQKAISQSDLKTVGRMLRGGVPKGAVETAVEGGHDVIAARLLLAGGKVSDKVMDSLVEKGSDLAGLAVDMGYDVTGKALPAKAAAAARYTLAEVLLERGCSPNEADSTGNTAFHYAAQNGRCDLIKSLVMFSADNTIKNKDGKTAIDLVAVTAKQILKEAKKAPTPKEKCEAFSLRFKEQGNKTFKTGEFCKAAKFYTVAISHNPSNHVLYSNRSACFFNQLHYITGLADASRCVKLNQSWAKGYFRKGSCLVQLELYDEALQTFNEGLKVDKKNADLVKAKAQLEKTIKMQK